MEFLPSAFAALGLYPQFIVYQLRPRKGSIRMDKVPVDPMTGRTAPKGIGNASWIDHGTAIKAAKDMGTGHGVGFVFDTKDPFWFLDIDNCLENNSWSPLSIELVQMFPGAAVEVSVSGTGLHIIGSGKPPSHGCKNKGLNIEFYTEGHFVALTGTHATGDASRDFTSILPLLINKYFPIFTNTDLQVSVNTEWTTGPRPEWSGPTDDDDLLGIALRSRSARSAFGTTASFADLWNAEETVLARVFPSKTGDIYDRSSADLTLAGHLAYWTGNDCERIERLMRRSALIREKWDRRDSIKGYLKERTILFAISHKTECFNDGARQLSVPAVASQPPARGEFITPAQQATFFRGCTWIKDENRVLDPEGDALDERRFKVIYGGRNFIMDHKNDRIIRNAWEAFTESQVNTPPVAHSTCFKPNMAPGAIIVQDGRRMVNIYYPVETARIKGDVTPFLKHTHLMIGDQRDEMIILCYMAACVQFKGEKFRYCPLVQGVQGNGKSLFAIYLEFCLGARYCHRATPEAVHQQFNSWIYAKLFISMQEVLIPHSSRDIFDSLKSCITDKLQGIEPKHQEQRTKEVCANFFLLSNHKDAIQKTQDDRRFATFYSRQQTEEDLLRDGLKNTDYFHKYMHWLEKQNGFAIINEYLNVLEIPDEFNPMLLSFAPQTGSTKLAIEESRGNVEQEILEAVEQGLPGFKGGWISSLMTDRLLESMGKHRGLTHNKRRDIIMSLDYVLHPGLSNGRVNNAVLPDGGKPRLFIKRGHQDMGLEGAAAARAYIDAQKMEG